MNASLDGEIFGKKKFKDLLQEIHTNQTKKSQQISALINELKPLASEDISSATLIVPLIKEYLEIGVKNDDQLVKLAAIIQKCLVVTGGGTGNDITISEEEKQQILEQVNKLNK